MIYREQIVYCCMKKKSCKNSIYISYYNTKFSDKKIIEGNIVLSVKIYFPSHTPNASSSLIAL